MWRRERAVLRQLLQKRHQLLACPTIHIGLGRARGPVNCSVHAGTWQQAYPSWVRSLSLFVTPCKRFRGLEVTDFIGQSSRKLCGRIAGVDSCSNSATVAAGRQLEGEPHTNVAGCARCERRLQRKQLAAISPARLTCLDAAGLAASNHASLVHETKAADDAAVPHLPGHP
eukprot:362014-Chlamydomonas_euryale.AAC.1